MKSEIRAYIAANLGITDSESIEMLMGSYREAMDENIAKMKKAMDASSLPDMALYAHALKGCSANIGAEELRVVCFEMEKAAKGGDSMTFKVNFGRLEELRTKFNQEL